MLLSRFRSLLFLVAPVASTVVLLSVCASRVAAQQETEPNDTIETANHTNGDGVVMVSGTLPDNNDVDFFALRSLGHGPIQITINADPAPPGSVLYLFLAGSINPAGNQIIFRESFIDFSSPITRIFTPSTGTPFVFSRPITMRVATTNTVAVRQTSFLSYSISITGLDPGSYVYGDQDGSSQYNPRLPDIIIPPPPPTPQNPNPPPRFVFNNTPSGDWADPPAVSGFDCEMTGGSLFTQIMDFPFGFASPFTVEANGIALGTFSSGQSVDFAQILGGGVSSFRVIGINPLVDSENPVGFPLKLAFNTPMASFTMTGITAGAPEPVSIAFLFVGGLAAILVRRKQR